jgi:hypothetical protein
MQGAESPGLLQCPPVPLPPTFLEASETPELIAQFESPRKDQCQVG